MKIGGLMARTVPELHRMNWNQLLRAWSASTGWSNNKIYLHLLLVLACSSVLFNLSLRALGGSLFIYLPMVALAFLLCLLLPANIYFAAVFSSRRPQLRQFIEENWDEFNR